MNISIPLKYYQDKSRINKADNQKTAYKVQVYANKVTDDYIESYKKGLPHKPSQAVLSANLSILNKPEVYRNYMRIVNSPYVDADYIDKVIMKNKANKDLNYVVEQEIIRIVKNLDIIEDMLQNYEVSFSEYEKLVQEQEENSLANSNRYQVLKEVIENNDDNDPYKIPKGYRYHDVKYTAENLLRQSQMKSQTEQIKFINKKSLENGEGDIYVEKYWIHTHKGKTTRHMSNHMQHVPIDQPFIVVNDYTLDIDEMMYPCDPMGRPSNSYICYCEMEYRTADGKIFIDPLQLELNVKNENENLILDDNFIDFDEFAYTKGQSYGMMTDDMTFNPETGNYEYKGLTPFLVRDDGRAYFSEDQILEHNAKLGNVHYIKNIKKKLRIENDEFVDGTKTLRIGYDTVAEKFGERHKYAVDKNGNSYVIEEYGGNLFSRRQDLKQEKIEYPKIEFDTTNHWARFGYHYVNNPLYGSVLDDEDYSHIKPSIEKLTPLWDKLRDLNFRKYQNEINDNDYIKNKNKVMGKIDKVINEIPYDEKWGYDNDKLKNGLWEITDLDSAIERSPPLTQNTMFIRYGKFKDEWCEVGKKIKIDGFTPVSYTNDGLNELKKEGRWKIYYLEKKGTKGLRVNTQFGVPPTPLEYLNRRGSTMEVVEFDKKRKVAVVKLYN